MFPKVNYIGNINKEDLKGLEKFDNLLELFSKKNPISNIYGGTDGNSSKNGIKLKLFLKR